MPREKVQEAFGKQLTELEEELWRWGNDEVNACDIYLTFDERDKSKISSFTVERLIKDARLYDALLKILKLGNVVLYFPGCAAPLVADLKAAEHMPPDMIEALGKPKRVTTGKQISEAIESDSERGCGRLIKMPVLRPGNGRERNAVRIRRMRGLPTATLVSDDLGRADVFSI